jgi:hypothetical protein
MGHRPVTSTAEFLAAVGVALDHLQVQTAQLERYTNELLSTMDSVEEGVDRGSERVAARRAHQDR